MGRWRSPTPEPSESESSRPPGAPHEPSPVKRSGAATCQTAVRIIHTTPERALYSTRSIRPTAGPSPRTRCRPHATGTMPLAADARALRELKLTNTTWARATIAALLATLVSAAGWFHCARALGDSRAQSVSMTLKPIAALLQDNQSIRAALRAPPFAEPDKGILQSYLVQLRRDGVAKTAPAKQRLDLLAENDAALMILITAYAPYARTAAFASGADRFRRYAAVWRDRWNSVMELYMAGGDYPATEVTFPNDFLTAVQAEMAASQ
jgi:hypothetical protein